MSQPSDRRSTSARRGTDTTVAKRLRRPALALGCVLMLAGCGTRLSDSAFKPFQVGQSTNPVPIGDGQSPAPGQTDGGPLPTVTTDSAPTGGSVPTSPTGCKKHCGPSPTSSASNPTGSKPNYASDTGVTANSITVCNVVTQGGPFGPYQFTPSYYGAAAYFQWLNNTQGGINGRKVTFIGHPDDGSNSGNLDQIHTCIDQNKAFSFVANNIFEYAGAQYTNQKGVPDIGGEPISTIYYQYPNLFSIDGLNQLHAGKPVTKSSKAYRWDEQATFFKQREHVTHVGVVYYDQQSSQYGANEIVQDYQHAGVKTSLYQVNLGLPNFASAVAQMKQDGVDLVADAVDENGDQKLCQAIEQNSAFENQMKVHLSTVSAWAASIGKDFAATPKCLSKSWADGYTANFQDTSIPEVSTFQTAMRKYFPSWLPHLSEWSLEGWVAASWFTEAAKSCGADLTRKCVIAYMNNKPDFGGNGVTVPYVSFRPYAPSFYNQPTRHCVSAAQFSVSANKWITRASPSSTCFLVKGYGFGLEPPT